MTRRPMPPSLAQTVAAGVALALALTLLLALPTGSSGVAGLSVPNGRFEDGRAGWDASRQDTVLSASENGRNGTRALRVTTRREGRTGADATRRVTDGSAAGTPYAWSAWMRASRTGLRGRIRVAEFLDGSLVQSRRATVRLVRGSWVRVRVAITRERAGSRFAVRVASPWQYRRDVLLVDDVRAWRTQAPQGAGPRLSNGCGTTRRGIPVCGAYLGSAYGSNTEPGSMESDMERRLGVRRTYFTGSQVDSGVRTAARDLAAGRLPWISFKLPHSWAAMAYGRGDAWARDLARRLARLRGPVWVAFHHEPEGDGDIQTWRRMQERLAPIVRATAPNVAFTVVLTGWHELYGDAQYRLGTIFPRVRVDVAGFDVYNQYGVVKDGRTNTKGTNLRTSYFEPISRWAAARGVEWGISETGFTDRAALVDPGWVGETYRALRELDGVAFTYFNTTLNSVANWALTTAPKRESYRDAAVGSPVLPRP